MKRYFVCDKCHEHIENIENGWVEWIETKVDDKKMHHGLRIVHKLTYYGHKMNEAGCKYNERLIYRETQGIVQDMPLRSFVGKNGAQSLIHLFLKFNFSKEEFSEFMKSILIIKYDFFMQHLPKALADGIADPVNDDLFQDDVIDGILEKRGEEFPSQ